MLRSTSIKRTFTTLKAIKRPSPYLKLTGEKISVEKQENKVPRHIPNGFWTPTVPSKRPYYLPLSVSTTAMDTLGLDPTLEPKDDFFRGVITGEKVDDGFSMAYAGFQFGEFAGQLGDGRVVNLFQAQGLDLQLKGTGLTPFSRFADGKAVLRSSIREYVISESLNAIGIPSSRALSLTALPKTLAQRNGAELCAVVCRMAPSWIRIGHFDLCRMRGDRDGVIELCDFLIDEVFEGHFSKEIERVEAGLAEGVELSKYDKLFMEIIIRNAKSVAYWQSYGFLNGVLNTDNTSVLGLAIDFGPFAFMDQFDVNFTPNSTDYTLRYSFKNTPSAIWFNMVKMGEAMGEFLGAGPEYLKDEHFQKEGVKDEWIDQFTKRATTIIEAGGELYEKVYIDEYLKLMCARLGITPRSSDNSEVLAILFETLQETKVNYNNFFVKLQNMKINSDETFDFELSPLALLPDKLKDDEFKEERERVLKELRSFLATFKARVEEELVSDEVRLERASKVNPLFVPSNWVFNEVIDYTTEKVKAIKERIDSGEGGVISAEDEVEAGLYLNKLMKMASHPYDKTQWGGELKELEERWLQESNGEPMIQCSCSS